MLASPRVPTIQLMGTTQCLTGPSPHVSIHHWWANTVSRVAFDGTKLVWALRFFYVVTAKDNFKHLLYKTTCNITTLFLFFGDWTVQQNSNIIGRTWKVPLEVLLTVLPWTPSLQLSRKQISHRLQQVTSTRSSSCFDIPGLYSIAWGLLLASIA